MKLKLPFILILFCSQFAFSQWVNLNTGINDNLSGAVFFQNNGLVSGNNGLYYTTTGGTGGGSWTRFQITDNAANSTIYENTDFTHCYSNPVNSSNTGSVYACGKDRVSNTAIVMRIDIPSLAYEILYMGQPNSALRQIAYNSSQNYYYAVGDNGLIIKFRNSVVSEVRNLGADNFTAISFNGSSCKIATDGKLLISSFLDSTYTFGTYTTPGATNKDIHFGNGYTFSVGNQYAYRTGEGVPTVYDNYDFGPLNANSFFYQSAASVGYVGTDHGIFRTGNFSVLEWFPSSQNYNIKEFWMQSITPTTIYACGNNGVLLKLTSGSGPVKPYAKIRSVGGCANQSMEMNAVTGVTSACSWFVNNQLVRSTCGNYYQSFTTPGQYEIKLTVQNSWGEQTTVTKMVDIVALPSVNKPVTISDVILCHGEAIEIQVENSEPNVNYTLKKVGDILNYGTSVPGNGGTITFTTGNITSSGQYYLQAANVLAPCGADFTDRINITVEQTAALYHKDLINAEVNETINFYGSPIEAQSYLWNMSPNAAVAQNVSEDTAATFSSAGPTTVTYDVWSANGCHDQLTGPGAYIYDTPLADDCWTVINRATDSSSSEEKDVVRDMALTTDGVISCGTYNAQTFNSMQFNSHSIPSKGAYVSKHDKNGILKWIAYTKHLPFFNDKKDEIYSTVVDQQGNIYICGESAGDFIDNRGNVVDLSPLSSPGSSLNGFIVKLDSQGKCIWAISSYSAGFHPTALYVDKENNLVATGSLNSTSGMSHQLFLNNVPTHIINQADLSVQGTRFTMLKIAPSGSVIWSTGINISHVNGASVKDIGFDGNNNLYLIGNFEFYSDFYSVGNGTAVRLLGYPGNEPDGSMYAAKYNEDGVFQWKLRSHTSGASFNGTSSYWIQTDTNGDSFVVGTNACTSGSIRHVFENTDGTTTQDTVGGLYFCKINSAGVCQWIRGTQNSPSIYPIGLAKENDKLYILGGKSATGDSTFVSNNGQSYILNMGYSDLFLATYDTSGNLHKVTVNGDNRLNGSFIGLGMGIGGVFKDNDAFYFCRNFSYPGSTYSHFGQTITSTNGFDASITKFKEECGIVKFDATLSATDFEMANNLTVSPNPTSGDFSIDFKEFVTEGDFEIVDVSGKEIMKQPFSNVNKINATIKGAAGLYFVKLKLGGKVSWFKVLKN